MMQLHAHIAILTFLACLPCQESPQGTALTLSDMVELLKARAKSIQAIYVEHSKSQVQGEVTWTEECKSYKTETTFAHLLARSSQRGTDRKLDCTIHNALTEAGWLTSKTYPTLTKDRPNHEGWIALRDAPRAVWGNYLISWDFSQLIDLGSWLQDRIKSGAKCTVGNRATVNGFECQVIEIVESFPSSNGLSYEEMYIDTAKTFLPIRHYSYRTFEGKAPEAEGTLKIHDGRRLALGKSLDVFEASQRNGIWIPTRGKYTLWTQHADREWHQSPVTCVARVDSIRLNEPMDKGLLNVEFAANTVVRDDIRKMRWVVGPDKCMRSEEEMDVESILEDLRTNGFPVSPRPEEPQPFLEANCAQKAAYAFLRSQGVKVTLKDLMAPSASHNAGGKSLDDLRTWCLKYNIKTVPSRIHRFPEQLHQTVILLLKATHEQEVGDKGVDSGAHFAFAHIKDGKIKVSGMGAKWATIGDLAPFWSGEALAVDGSVGFDEKRVDDSRLTTVLILGIGAIGATLLIAFFRRRRRTATTGISP